MTAAAGSARVRRIEYIDGIRVILPERPPTLDAEVARVLLNILESAVTSPSARRGESDDGRVEHS